MTFRRRLLTFTISTDAAFNEDGIWVIDAHLRFQQRPSGKTRSALLGDATDALRAELIREALRGRVHGANVIRVRLETGGRVTELSFDERVPNVDLLS